MRRLSVLLAVLALGACADQLPWEPLSVQTTPPTPATKPTKPASKKSSSTADKPPSNGEKPGVAVNGQQPVPPTSVPPSPPAAQTPQQVAVAPVPSAPVKLVGRNEEGIRQLLGDPSSLSERPPARLWVYENAHCRLELSFYLDVASRNFKVLTQTVTPQGSQPLRGNDCVAALTSRSPS